MIHLYPANRIENLVLLFDRILQLPVGNPLAEEIVIVQNQGMQHWLSMSLARLSGVCMNLRFLLPAQYFWQQINALVNARDAPPPSLYSREVMRWRLDALLASEATRAEPLCREATRYWYRGGRGDALKRYQLAARLADLFEQYLIYRPDWIMAWDNGDTPHWQAWLWRRLVAEQPDHPLRLYRRAVDRLGEADGLPERISLFGLNALPPMWLDFLGALGRHAQIHLFHLNPCVEYWGDIRSEKQLARQLARWSDDAQWADDSGNPLLAGLGAQGREFLSLLQERENTEIPVYEAPEQADDDATPHRLLHRLQNDILELRDARERPETLIDDSMTFVSAHNALREVQGLHDWLLHRFNEDPSLTPADVVVMCPRVEHYAPYVEAVFSRGWRQRDDSRPRLPCSIADRVLKDAEPLVAAFLDLLQLPDSRFQVSEIIAWLRLPAMQQRFGLAHGDLEKISRWLRRAAIHWGLDAAHKAHTLQLDDSNASFTWRQGLDRLLLGFAHGDAPALYQDSLLLPDVEGDDAILLGRLVEILDELQRHARELRQSRSAGEWRDYLTRMRDELFSELPEDRDARVILAEAIDDFSEYTLLAGYHEEIPLAVLRDYLAGCFNLPEPGRQFMTGQITFCSMIPMRSVPFRIIAVLGLNDGEYPRQRAPLGFDLMADETPRKGDRSRRGDDRYLFLEVLISARERLYLSYQGNDIKTNQQRQPSLILKELMDYLQAAHGWDFEQPGQLHRLPLHAFSPVGFAPSARDFQGFDRGWLRLATPGDARPRRQAIPEPKADELPGAEALPLESLIDFLDQPARAFAHRRLALWLDIGADEPPDDSEPFSADHLLRYQFQQDYIDARLDPTRTDDALDTLTRCYRLDGRLPDTPDAEENLREWRRQADEFAAMLIDQQADRINIEHALLDTLDIPLVASLPWRDDGLLFHRLADIKPKDELRLWLHHLFAHCHADHAAREISTRGYFRPTAEGKPPHCLLFPPLPRDEAAGYLTDILKLWRAGMREPLLLDGELGHKLIDGKLDEQCFEKRWADNWNRRGLGHDAYIHWFWPERPALNDLPLDALRTLHGPLREHRREEK